MFDFPQSFKLLGNFKHKISSFEVRELKGIFLIGCSCLLDGFWLLRCLIFSKFPSLRTKQKNPFLENEKLLSLFMDIELFRGLIKFPALRLSEHKFLLF